LESPSSACPGAVRKKHFVLDSSLDSIVDAVNALTSIFDAQHSYFFNAGYRYRGCPMNNSHTSDEDSAFPVAMEEFPLMAR
jgi:hypothetical protein